ncbi:ROK family glucokinase [Vallicoccus soli]|uniref:Glucokinase n=1 Tax=Vallicoccus soli TaxID=2339232 RepID=A0A3A3YYN6_9ACTN|nr:ROK family glucokinase [Vallicoccus soli]RJK96881.1 ROK family protein [Vallicoccus soli]
MTAQTGPAHTIGVDVGGTKVAAGLVAPDGTIVAKTRRSTPPGDTGAGTVAAIVDTIEELRAGAQEVEVRAVGIGAAGFVDVQRTTVVFAPNLAEWPDDPLATQVEARVGLRTVVENDANAAAWGEVEHGAGRGEAYVVCITVGTGIGGGIVLGGELYRGRWGVAAEIGHLRVVPGGRPCGCGNRGCWEQYASGRALVREARTRAEEDPDLALDLLALGDGTIEGIEGRHVTAAAQKGDPVALGAFEACGTWLGQGMADLAAILDPGCFVIGGGVSEAGDALLEPARRAFRAALTAGSHRPNADVRRAVLGNDAGIVGAAALARR